MVEKSRDGSFNARTGGRPMAAGVEAFQGFVAMIADLHAAA